MEKVNSFSFLHIEKSKEENYFKFLNNVFTSPSYTNFQKNSI